MLVAVEGINGCGKTTILTEIERYCSLYNLRASVITSKPPEEDLLKIKEFSSGTEFNIDTAKKIALVFIENMKRIGDEIFSLDEIVFSSRWTLANYVYTLYNCPPEYKEELSNFLLEQYNKILIPNFTIFINASPEVCMSRIDKRGNIKIKSRYENIESLSEIYNLYCDIVENEFALKDFTWKLPIIIDNETDLSQNNLSFKVNETIFHNDYIASSLSQYVKK